MSVYTPLPHAPSILCLLCLSTHPTPPQSYVCLHPTPPGTLRLMSLMSVYNHCLSVLCLSIHTHTPSVLYLLCLSTYLHPHPRLMSLMSVDLPVCLLCLSALPHPRPNLMSLMSVYTPRFYVSYVCLHPRPRAPPPVLCLLCLYTPHPSPLCLLCLSAPPHPRPLTPAPLSYVCYVCLHPLILMFVYPPFQPYVPNVCLRPFTPAPTVLCLLCLSTPRPAPSVLCLLWLSTPRPANLMPLMSVYNPLPAPLNLMPLMSVYIPSPHTHTPVPPLPPPPPPHPRYTLSYWAIQAGLLTPFTFALHRLSPLAAFTSGAYFLHNGRR